jgi:hypothetical protein
MGVLVRTLATGAVGAVLSLFHDSASPAASDAPGTLVVAGRDSAANYQEYGRIQHVVTDPTSTSEDSKWVVSTQVAGTMTDVLALDGVANTIPVGGLAVTGQVIVQTATGLRFNNHVSGAGAATGTLTNAPAAGNPAFWLPVNIAGTVRYIPCW